MRRHHLIVFIILLAATGACQQPRTGPGAPTAIPFPTVTPGRELVGVLATPRPPGDGAGVSNPSTAVALADQPTATPDMSACPPLSDNADLASLPDTGDEIIAEIARFLSAGGSPVALEAALRDDWEIMAKTVLSAPIST